MNPRIRRVFVVCAEPKCTVLGSYAETVLDNTVNSNGHDVLERESRFCTVRQISLAATRAPTHSIRIYSKHVSSQSYPTRDPFRRFRVRCGFYSFLNLQFSPVRYRSIVWERTMNIFCEINVSGEDRFFTYKKMTERAWHFSITYAYLRYPSFDPRGRCVGMMLRFFSRSTHGGNTPSARFSKRRHVQKYSGDTPALY